MIILPAGLIGDELFLWGEQPLEANLSSGKLRKRSSKIVSPPFLPYGTPEKELLSALHTSGVMVDLTRLRSKPMTVWLSTVPSPYYESTTVA